MLPPTYCTDQMWLTPTGSRKGNHMSAFRHTQLLMLAASDFVSFSKKAGESLWFTCPLAKIWQRRLSI